MITKIEVQPIKYSQLEAGKQYMMMFASNAKYPSLVSKEVRHTIEGNQVKIYHLNRVTFSDCATNENNLFSKAELEIQFDGIDLGLAEKSGLISFREVLDIKEIPGDPIPAGFIF